MPEWTTLEMLQPGAVFKTRDGVLAVKSEYHMPNAQSECVLLASGEYAHFPKKNNTEVQEIPLALIENAPRLLEVAKGLLTVFKVFNDAGLTGNKGYEAVKDIIAEAEGQTDATD